MKKPPYLEHIVLVEGGGALTSPASSEPNCDRVGSSRLDVARIRPEHVVAVDRYVLPVLLETRLVTYLSKCPRARYVAGEDGSWILERITSRRGQFIVHRCQCHRDWHRWHRNAASRSALL